jgi:hypothetical protein
MDRQKVYIDNYKNMKIWACTKLNIPNELAEDIVHTFYIKWMSANIEDRNIALHPLLWKAFKNSAFTFLMREAKTSSKAEVYKTFDHQVGPDVYVLPKISFEQYCSTLSEYDRHIMRVLLSANSPEEAASQLNMKRTSLNNRKSMILKPLFNRIFLGGADGT